MIAQDCGMDVEKIAGHLQWPVAKVQAVLDYYLAFLDVINAAVEDNDSYDFEKVKRTLPQVELFETGLTHVSQACRQ